MVQVLVHLFFKKRSWALKPWPESTDFREEGVAEETSSGLPSSQRL